MGTIKSEAVIRVRLADPKGILSICKYRGRHTVSGYIAGYTDALRWVLGE